MSFRKLPECHQCQFYAHSVYLICAIHPNGPKSDRCGDFLNDPSVEHPLEHPPSGSWYGGDLVVTPDRLTHHARLRMLETHPLFNEW